MIPGRDRQPRLQRRSLCVRKREELRCGEPVSTVVHQHVVAFRTASTKRAYFGGQGMGHRMLPFLSRGTYKEEVSPAGEVFYSGMSGHAGQHDQYLVSLNATQNKKNA